MLFSQGDAILNIRVPGTRAISCQMLWALATPGGGIHWVRYLLGDCGGCGGSIDRLGGGGGVVLSPSYLPPPPPPNAGRGNATAVTTPSYL